MGVLAIISNILDSIPLINRLVDYYQKSKAIPGLEITLSFGKGGFSGAKDCFYLEFVFFNNTGNKVQISNLQIADITSLFRVHPLADKDRMGNFHPLKFLDEKGSYARRHIIIETNLEEKTGIPLVEDYTENELKLLIGELNSLPKNIKKIKYFTLKFLVTLGYNRPQEKEYRY
jgi:hypothetical protein